MTIIKKCGYKQPKKLLNDTLPSQRVVENQSTLKLEQINKGWADFVKIDYWECWNCRYRITDTEFKLAPYNYKCPGCGKSKITGFEPFALRRVNNE